MVFKDHAASYHWYLYRLIRDTFLKTKNIWFLGIPKCICLTFCCIFLLTIKDSTHLFMKRHSCTPDLKEDRFYLTHSWLKDTREAKIKLKLCYQLLREEKPLANFQSLHIKITWVIAEGKREGLPLTTRNF